jgi:hypothetical protein
VSAAANDTCTCLACLARQAQKRRPDCGAVIPAMLARCVALPAHHEGRGTRVRLCPTRLARI